MLIDVDLGPAFTENRLYLFRFPKLAARPLADVYRRSQNEPQTPSVGAILSSDRRERQVGLGRAGDDGYGDQEPLAWRIG